MKIWQCEVNASIANLRSKNTMVEHLGIEFTDVGEDYMTARMPVDPRTRQPLGIMHGGASCVLAETVGSTAANFCVNPEKQYCVGLDINTNHIRSIREGFVYAKALPYHIGRSTQVWNIEIRDEQMRLISINRLTMAVLNRETK
jgi:1,4-dihydroxy-2-naphthoyl-CoA hydrolase